MKTANEIKKWIKEQFGIDVRVRTIPSVKQNKWQEAWIKPTSYHPQLTYSTLFPVDFCRFCIKMVYPASPDLHQQTAAGNIAGHCIALYGDGWEVAMSQYHKPV